MNQDVLAPAQKPAPHPYRPSNDVTRMDILFVPSMAAIQSVVTAILAIATTLQAASQEWIEAESALQRGVESACGATRDGHKRVRCRVMCREECVTVIVADVDEHGRTRIPSAQTAFRVYSDSGCSIWLVEDARR